MAKNISFTRQYYAHISEYDALQDLLQNWADQAFGVDQRLSMPLWNQVGMTSGTLTGDEVFNYTVNDRVVGHLRIKAELYNDGIDGYTLTLRNNDITLKRDAFLSMGYTTKKHNTLTVGCRGVGAKNAVASWVVRLGNRFAHPIKAHSGGYCWEPYFIPATEQFSIPKRKRTANNSDNRAKKAHLEKLFQTVLWLKTPPADQIILANETGQLFRSDGPYAKRIFLYHNYIAHYDNARGVNIFPTKKDAIRPTSDRKNIERDCYPALIQHVVDLWKKAVSEKPESIEILYDLVGTDQKCWETTTIAPSFAAELVSEFRRRHGERAYPVTKGTIDDTKWKLRKAFNFVPVQPEMYQILVEHLGLPDAILLREMEGAHTVDIEDSLKGWWEELICIVDIDASVVYAGLDERFPFMVQARDDGKQLTFNAHHFIGDHQKFCSDAEERCNQPEECHNITCSNNSAAPAKIYPTSTSSN
ncbi:hypothetical protein HK097_007362 [Rhizophlyctis rosea]|uniref:Uncharacterized protein n=1 Tax=Rhizophlyctis rosea TaxID=64517 RepID=A0AAD5SD87_9FUNG|nr:hypothetical protein HK097_007362 [Rhizophlyctis rosea]